MVNTEAVATMTAGELAGKLGWDAVADLALSADSGVTILADGTVNGLERGMLVANIAHLSTVQMLDALADEVVWHHYNTPIEPARHGITVDEAREIASVDPALVYVTAR